MNPTDILSHLSSALAQSQSDRLPSAAAENKYRGPQPDNMQRDLRRLSPVRDVSIKALPPPGSESLVEEEAERVKSRSR